MLMPKRTKHRKMFRPRKMQGRALRGNKVAFGDFGLIATEPAWISARQLEAGRRAITNYLKRGGKVWIRIYPDKSITQKPAETRMGSGKGAPEYWVAVVKPDRVMYEIGGVDQARAEEALRRAAMKMPIKCKFVISDRVLAGGEIVEIINTSFDLEEAEIAEEAAAEAAAEATEETAADEESPE